MDAWQIERAMIAYADALDARDWAALDRVFADDVEMAGDALVRGRAAFVANIRRFLDPCGPTQHLLGPTRADVAGDEAESVTPFRAFHCDRTRATRTFEVLGRYHVGWTRTAYGWRARRWRYDASAQVGDPGVLGGTIC